MALRALGHSSSFEGLEVAECGSNDRDSHCCADCEIQKQHSCC